MIPIVGSSDTMKASDRLPALIMHSDQLVAGEVGRTGIG